MSHVAPTRTRLGTTAGVDTSVLWQFEGQYYDLDGFLTTHPGGRLALLLGKGRDCTMLVRTYHPVSVETLRRWLAPYLVNIEGVCHVPMEADPLLDDLHRMARQYRNRQGTWKTPWWAWLYTLFMMGVVARCIQGFLAFEWWAAVAWPVTQWLMAWCMHHEGSHFNVSSVPWINRLVSMTSVPFINTGGQWYLQHVVQHHLYTNEYGDVDLDHTKPLGRSSFLQTWYPRYRWTQPLSVLLLFMTAAWALSIMYPIRVLLFPTSVYRAARNPHFIVREVRGEILAQVIVSVGVLLYPMLYGHYGYAVLPWLVASIIFSTLTQVSHLQAECHQEADAAKTWSQRQICHAMDYRPTSRLWNMLTIGLTAQSIHHVLPFVNCCHFPNVYEEFRTVCAKHGVVVHCKSGLLECLHGMWKWFRVLHEAHPENESLYLHPS